MDVVTLRLLACLACRSGLRWRALLRQHPVLMSFSHPACSRMLSTQSCCIFCFWALYITYVSADPRGGKLLMWFSCETHSAVCESGDSDHCTIMTSQKAQPIHVLWGHPAMLMRPHGLQSDSHLTRPQAYTTHRPFSRWYRRQGANPRQCWINSQPSEWHLYYWIPLCRCCRYCKYLTWNFYFIFCVRTEIGYERVCWCQILSACILSLVFTYWCEWCSTLGLVSVYFCTSVSLSTG